MKAAKNPIFLIVCMQLLFSSAQADEFFREDAKEVVIDKERNLMWQDDDYSSRLDIPFTKAKAYCENLSFSAYDDWYLPSVHELKTIIDVDNYPKTVEKTFMYIASDYYWSSTEYGSEYAWLVLFRNGSVDYYYITDTNHIRCVRKLRE